MFILFKILAAVNSLADGDVAVDLTELGFDDFTPYSVERNSLWILLPALSLVLVMFHLKRNRKKLGNQK